MATALWKEDIVQKNRFSRPGISLLSVMAIVVHWTANPGGSDEAHANYFDGEDGGGGRAASAHLFVDRDSASLIVPLNEVAYQANEKPSKVKRLLASVPTYRGGNANLNTIGVEMCVEKDGTIHKDTVARTVKVVAELCKRFKLDPSADIYRHYDITGKNCPAPWVARPDLFEQFKKDVKVASTPKPTIKAVYHVVKKGETVSGIALKYKTTIQRIKVLNKLKNIDLIYPGQKLRVK
ncbi:hypothetical protein AM500_21325 [Bacillus sp. FJAT-18017]|uniref:N-acetylmuramoyl-L-alanine amidase n=1 Tax=Bacillus sp. FJAT-18017 TaxID=1705566 RepID=UPI0006ADBA22|nr:N-acetylmuramoyl-L-alanine amidase [Bacillus sp. FJAT-18017]ALC92051.1 hypothetical protein AM500_21325 [Bacillus sp. FJAT-18017]